MDGAELGARLATLAIWTQDILLQSFKTSEEKKNHKYHRENILERTVSYIYVNVYVLIYIAAHSFMCIQAIISF